MFDEYSAKSARKLVDKFFSLQWCRDNLVVPLYEEQSSNKVIIAIANYSYLGTIADPIQQRLKQSGAECIFIQKSQEEIQKILDLALELKAEGIGVIIITHNLHHMFSVADRITVLQNGSPVGDKKVADTNIREIEKLIIGNDFS